MVTVNSPLVRERYSKGGYMALGVNFEGEKRF
jgi:hypothetical protein